MTIQRNIPQAVLRELQREDSEEALLVFLTIYNVRLYEPIRVVSDPENFILDGKEYQGFEFNISLLSDDDSAPKANLSIQNTDERISRAILETTEPIYLDLQVIALSEFDMTQYPRTEKSNPSVRTYRAKYLRLTDVTGNSLSMTGTLRSWDYTQETWPALKATEDRFPALFWS